MDRKRVMRERFMKKMKKMKEKNGRKIGRRALSAFALTMALGLTACGASDSKSSIYADTVMNGASDGGYYEMTDEAPMAAEPQMEAGSSMQSSSGATGNSAYYESRKLIRTVNLDVETKEFDQMLVSVENQVTALGGYIEQMNTYNGSSYSESYRARSSNLTARIPKQSVDSFLSTVEGEGNVVSRSEHVEDVTLSYVDMESRKKSLQTEQERLLTFLEKAENLEDIITLESRLSDVRYQLESMESQLRTYDNKVDFATVEMSIREVKELTPVTEEETAWERLAKGFMKSLENVKDGIVDFFIWFVVNIPYFVVWAAVIFIIVMIIKLIKRSARRKREAKHRSSQAASGAEETKQQDSRATPKAEETKR